VLTSIGGQLVELAAAADLGPAVARLFPQARQVASRLVPATVAVTQATPTAALTDIDLAVLQAEFGVCENGAVWLPESQMLHRALPTVAQHLVVVLGRAQLVPTMHQAYARLARPLGGYGVFLAGPSKTADIEQSLVIGAHGARSLTVLLHG
jgi:L-lactate dehydrogenase complex protein LldG